MSKRRKLSFSPTEEYARAFKDERFEDAAYWAGVCNSFSLDHPQAMLLAPLMPHYSVYLMGWDDYVEPER